MTTTTDSIEQLLQQRETLLGLVEAITAELELRPLLTRIIQSACELIGADRGSIGLVESARNVVRTEATYRMPAAELGSEMPMGVGLAGAVLRNRRPVVLDRYGDVVQPVHTKHHDDAVIGVPILWQTQMIGFFGIGNSPRPDGSGPRLFDAADAEALQVFARHAAVAIVNARRYAERKRRGERFELIARIGRLITAAPCVDDLLQNATDAIHEVLGFPNVVIGVVDDRQADRLVIRAASGATRMLLEATDLDAAALPEGVELRAVDGASAANPLFEFVVSTRVGLIGAAARERRTVVCNDTATDARYMPLPGMPSFQSDMALPLMLGDALLGVINLESTAPLNDEDRVGMQIVVDQLAIAMENTRLYEQSTRIAALQERERIARDLHDSVTQQLFGLTMIAESISPVWRRDPSEGERRAQRVLELSRAALAEMRALLAELRAEDPDDAAQSYAGPALVRRRGLAIALHEYARRAALMGARIELDTASYTSLPVSVETTLYRFVQEALHNAIKHARASRIRLSLERRTRDVRLLLEDDGVGFAVDATDAAKHMGLRHMEERIASLNGVLHIRSAPGRGTRVEAILPPPERGK